MCVCKHGCVCMCVYMCVVHLFVCTCVCLSMCAYIHRYISVHLSQHSYPNCGAYQDPLLPRIRSRQGSLTGIFHHTLALVSQSVNTPKASAASHSSHWDQGRKFSDQNHKNLSCLRERQKQIDGISNPNLPWLRTKLVFIAFSETKLLLRGLNILEEFC